MKKYIFLFIVFAVFVFGCTKTSDNKVFIRIKNDTSTGFKEISTNYKSFLNVKAFDTTTYQVFNEAKASLVTLIDNSGDTSVAGAIPIDGPIPALYPGKYTLRIYADTSTYYGYGSTYIKD